MCEVPLMNYYGSYNINGVVGPYGGIKYIDPLSKAQWSSESLAGSGIR